MKKIIAHTSISAIMLLSASSVFAADSSFCPDKIGTITDLINKVTCIIGSSIFPLLITIAVLIFIVGVIKYIANGGNEEKRKEGRDFIVWGIIGLFAIFSVWGLVAILKNTIFDGGLVVPQL